MVQTSKTDKRPDTVWRRSLLKARTEWSRAGFEWQWHLLVSKFNYALREFEREIPASQLFTSEECKARRRQLRQALDETYRARLLEELRLPWWKRVFRRRVTSVDQLQVLYSKRRRSIEFERHYDLYLRERKSIDALTPDSLFSPAERAVRSYRHTRPLRRQFTRQQRETLRKFKAYARLMQALPADPIDRELYQLEEDFQYLRGSREWIREYEQLVDAVLDDELHDVEGVNEPGIRLLQNDFLLTMQGRLPAYWHYFQLRRRCFDEGISDLVRQISYFEQDLLERHYREDDIEDCHTLLEEFTQKIDNVLSDNQQHERHGQLIDHGRRMSEWDTLRPFFDEPIPNVVAAFNRLKPVLRACPEWRHELNIFNALLMVRRDINGKRKNSPEEIDDIHQFVTRLVARIDAELATDVAFQSLEQELTVSGGQLDRLERTLRLIASRRRANSPHSAEEINRIKQKFIKATADQRSTVREGATVIPLLTPPPKKFPPSNTSGKDHKRR